jgi:RNA recognition motif-containing protein
LWVSREAYLGNARAQVQLRSDERYGIVRFVSPDSARSALETLNGTEILGEGLTVTTTDPAATARNTKRPRVAE